MSREAVLETLQVLENMALHAGGRLKLHGTTVLTTHQQQMIDTLKEMADASRACITEVESGNTPGILEYTAIYQGGVSQLLISALTVTPAEGEPDL